MGPLLKRGPDEERNRKEESCESKDKRTKNAVGASLELKSEYEYHGEPVGLVSLKKVMKGEHGQSENLPIGELVSLKKEAKTKNSELEFRCEICPDFLIGAEKGGKEWLRWICWQKWLIRGKYLKIELCPLLTW